MKDSAWPPFSGDHSSCPKCGQVGPVTQWKAGYEPAPEDGPGLPFRPLSDFGPERLRRTCIRCGYWWEESIVTEPPRRKCAAAENNATIENRPGDPVMVCPMGGNITNGAITCFWCGQTSTDRNAT